MRFTLVDRITEFVPGQSITAVKNLSLAEEYLADHFPGFPVMPGVLMLEAMTQASAWLVRGSDDFAYSSVLLKEARNVKYASFVRPGQMLVVTAELLSSDGPLVKLKTQGTVNGQQVVSARLVLERKNLADADPNQVEQDQTLVKHLRELWNTLYKVGSPQPISSGVAGATPT
jgi:3-hydroxyacyl-[acyl-carrier-protein] dehydratase